MSRPLAVLISLLGAGVFLFAFIAPHWASGVRHITSSEEITFGCLAALGVVLMFAGYRVGGWGLVALDLAVVLVLGFLYLQLSSATSRSPTRRAMADISTIATAIDGYAFDHNNDFPPAQSIDDLARDISPTYIKTVTRKDPWGAEYRYEMWEGHFAIGSAGWDAKFEKPSLRQYTLRATANHDCDLILQDGYFVSYPEGVPVDKPPNFDEATKLYKEDHYAEAIPIFVKFLEKNPDHALANARLGMSLCSVNRFQDAIPYLNRAIALDPADYQSRGNLGLVYEKLGKPEEGIEWERKAVALQPDNPQVLNNLGWVLLQAKHNSEAVKVFERTVRLAPAVKTYRENLELARKAAGAR